MKTRLPKLLALCSVLTTANLLAQSSVWKVSSGNHDVYIGGTCHILRPSDFPLPDEFAQAYEQADRLVFEIDPSQLQSPAFSQQLMAASRFENGKTLKDVLSNEAYRALEKQAAASGLPMAILDPIKPGMAVTMLMMTELMKIGVTQEGVDLYYAKQAHQDQKPIDSLETVDFQIDLLTSLGEGMESELVLYSLKDLEQIESVFDQLITAWQQGDLESIQTLFVDDMAHYPAIYDAMLKDRNQRWIPQIESMLEDDETEYVLVGLAHIAGPDGILQLLESAGYQIEQVQ